MWASRHQRTVDLGINQIKPQYLKAQVQAGKPVPGFVNGHRNNYKRQREEKKIHLIAVEALFCTGGYSIVP